MEINLETVKEQIKSLDQNSIEAARKRWLSVAKPLFSLGRLEEMIIQIAGIKGTAEFQLKRRGLVIMCADNGVVGEGVTQTGQEVTAVVAENFTKNAASICMMSEVAGTDLFPVDIGMVSDIPGLSRREKKVAYGTRNLLKEPALTRTEVLTALQVGVEEVRRLKEQDYDILATGEMGIGNTTTSTAVACTLLEADPAVMTGRGAGLDQKGLARKQQVITQALEKHHPDPTDVIDVLAKVGGLDIAGLTGVFIGSALYRLPVIIDGFIAGVAALCAVRLVPQIKEYLLPSHLSGEPGGTLVLAALDLEPLLTCGMSLGEGSGAVAILPLIDMALKVYREMSTFHEINIDSYEVLK